jgi:hypothetical protein
MLRVRYSATRPGLSPKASARSLWTLDGVDYGKILAPVSQYMTLRILLAVVATEDPYLHQLDIKTAFLSGTVEVELDMLQPPGYARHGDQCVCRRYRPLYGLKQASRV